MLLEARVTHPTTEADAVRLAREIYGLVASAKTLPGEYDENFHLTPVGPSQTRQSSVSLDARGVVVNEPGEFVLKVMHPAREQSFIDLQCRALQHLAQRAPRLTLPRVVPAGNNKLFSAITAPDGSSRLVWLLTYVRGMVLAAARPHSAELLASLGRLLGEMDIALQDFSHFAAHRELKWDLSRAVWIREYIPQIAGPSRRALVEKFLALYEAEIVPALSRLRRSVIYGDANDYNALVGEAWEQPRKVISVIDFGDLHHGTTASEVAIAAAYAMLGKKDALRAAATVIGGYHSAFALQDPELAVLYGLIGMRLAVSVTNSAHRKNIKPEDSYVTISEAPAWEALERFGKIHPRFAHYTFREACGFAPVPQRKKIERWLTASAKSAAAVVGGAGTTMGTTPSIVLDLSVGSTFLGADPKAAEEAALSKKIFAHLKSAGVSIGVGRYDEARLLYTSELFAGVTENASEDAGDERRTVHLGIDLFIEPDTAVCAPLKGTVHTLANNTAPQDYGPLVILKHATDDGQTFFTLYGH